jgi:hypothetical protein
LRSKLGLAGGAGSVALVTERTVDDQPAHDDGVAAPPHRGSLDPEAVRRVVREHIDELRRCYQLGLDRDPALAARISISFTIGPSGAVVEAHAVGSADYPYPEVPACIEAELLRWRFPAPRDGGSVVVSYPFTFGPE